jgi:hypothetical protein
MEQQIIFEDLHTDKNEIEFYAFYNQEDGSVFEIFPGFPTNTDKKFVKVDTEILDSIESGHSNIFSYYVDIKTQNPQLQKKTNSNFVLTKIDDILHRVIEKKWAKIKNPDVQIKYSKKNEVLEFKINPSIKNIQWPGEQEMIFLITGYNDPNSVKHLIRFTVDELASFPQIHKIKLRSKFSIFTRRLFTNYTLEIK